MQRPRDPRPLVLLAVPLLAGMVSPVQAARLTGTVELRPLRSVQKATMGAYAGTMGSMCCGSSQQHSMQDVRDVVLFLEGLVDSTRSRSDRPQLKQVRQLFQPRVLGIPVGTTVDFPNLDPVFHNVFSYSSPKRFDLGKYGKGKSRSVTFEKPGIVRVFCEIHSNMSAYIYVVDSSFVTQPDERGAFDLQGIPPGAYTLQTWHPELGLQSRSVRIPVEGATVELEL